MILARSENGAAELKRKVAPSDRCGKCRGKNPLNLEERSGKGERSCHFEKGLCRKMLLPASSEELWKELGGGRFISSREGEGGQCLERKGVPRYGRPDEPERGAPVRRCALLWTSKHARSRFPH